MDRVEETRNIKITLRDINTGEEVTVLDPQSYDLQTVLISSAYYRKGEKEYRFLLCQAREVGLAIEKKLVA
jgi:hypothetical protein